MDNKIRLLMNAHDELQDQVRFGDSKALARDFAAQIHVLSRISVKKYASIRKSITYFGISNICFLGAILRASLI